MPLFAYRCASCGHAQDVLQKISDDVLTVCPACGAASFVKQLTAAGFQLKGSGWYVTDFRGGNTGAKEAVKEDAADSAKDATPVVPGDTAKAEAPAPAAGKGASAVPAADTARPAPAPAAPAAPKAGV